MVFRAMGPDEITWGVRMEFMKHFGTKNGFLYRRLGATVLDNNSYSIPSMERVVSKSLRKRWNLTWTSKDTKDRKGFFLLSCQA